MQCCPAQDVHPQLWKGANRKFDRVPWRRIEAERHNAERTPAQQVRACLPILALFRSYCNSSETLCSACHEHSFLLVLVLPVSM